MIQTQADELLPLKNKIDELKKRVKEIKRAITDILSNDNDMNQMYLSYTDVTNNDIIVDINSNSNMDSDNDGNEDNNENNNENNNFINPDGMKIYSNKNIDVKNENIIVDTMNLEMLFENYLNEVEWIASEVEEVIDEITNTEENVVLQLDLLRNRILRFELSLSMSSYVVTCGALITGLFGMNLISHLETDKNVFYIVTALLVSGMAAMYTSFNNYQKKTFGELF